MKKVVFEYFESTNSYSIHIDTYESDDSEIFSRHSCAFSPGEIDTIRGFISNNTDLDYENCIPEGILNEINTHWTEEEIEKYNLFLKSFEE